MLTYEQLQRALKLNELLMARALRARDYTRIYELGNHRMILKDCLIELLTATIVA